MPAGLSLSNIQKGRNLAELYFVRHGQASSGTDNYDRLSPVGEQQGLWLGEYFAERKITFDRVVIGAMQRHRQTADAILRGLGATLSCEQDLGLNEYDFHALYAAAGDANFYQDKLQAARYYIEWELPVTAAQFDLLSDVNSIRLDMRVE